MDSERTTEYLVRLLRAWAQEEPAPPPPGPAAGSFLELIRRNRIEGFLHDLLPSELTGEWTVVAAACREAYHANLLHGLRQLKAGAELAGRLEAEGIPCFALRGPFSGADLYGDVGLRGFTDIDLYVPVRQRHEAWRVAAAAGYELNCGGLPRGFYERHHLHWPLVGADGRTSCDLHWALDHPYTLHRIDYASLFESSERRFAEGHAWQQPAPDHLLLAACLHLAKHCPQRFDWAEAPEVALRMAAQGRLRQWIEVAAVLRRYRTRFRWRRIEELVPEWRMGREWRNAMDGVRCLFDLGPPDSVSLPEAPAASPRADGNAPRWTRAIARLGAFQQHRVLDARAYLFPPAWYFTAKTPAARALQRAAHTATAVPRLLLAAGEAAFWPVWLRLRGKKGNADAALLRAHATGGTRRTP